MSQDNPAPQESRVEIEIYLDLPPKPEGVSVAEYVRAYAEFFTQGEVANPPGWWIARMDQVEALLDDPESRQRRRRDREAFLAMIRAKYEE